MLTVSDFVRWLREKVIDTPAVAGYEITLLFDLDNTREEAEEWFVDHQMKQVVIVGKNTDEPAAFGEDFYDEDE